MRGLWGTSGASGEGIGGGLLRLFVAWGSFFGAQDGLGFAASIRKIVLVSVKLLVRNSGAGNGCANFMDAWKNCVLSAGKPSMSIKFLVLGGGDFGFFFFFWGGESRFYFMGARLSAPKSHNRNR